jgi:hypothetical protein
VSKESRRDRKARKKGEQPEDLPVEAAGGDEAAPSDPEAVLDELLAPIDPREPAAPDASDEASALDRDPVWRDSSSSSRPAPTEPIGSPLGAPDPRTKKRRSRRIEPETMVDPLDRPDPTRRQRRADKKRSKELVAAATMGSSSAAGPDDPDRGPRRSRRMRAFRFPALLIVIALIAAAFVIERRVTPPIAEVTSGPDLGRVMPTATPAGAASSTWFCAGGTALGEPSSVPKDVVGAGGAPAATGAALRIPEDRAQAASTTTSSAPTGTNPPGSNPPGSNPPGTTRPAAPKVAIVAEQSIEIGNASDRSQAVTVTVYPSEGTPVVRRLDLAGHTRQDLRLSDVVKAPYASALVESDGGLLSVAQSVQGPNGRSVGPCASSPSASWYFAAGSTRLGTREVFVAFNPFPANAVLDFSFQVAEEGGRQASRDSDKLKGQVVPANGVVAFDVSDIVTVREQLSTVVRTRGGEGRVVVARLLVSDGTSNHPKSINQTLGAPTPMPTWLFADGPVLEPGVQSSYVLYNPGATIVDAAVSVQPDAQGVGLEVAPFEVKVRPGQFEIVPISNARVPANSGYWVSVQSRDGGGLVAERVVRSDLPASRPGVSYTLGSPLVANRWLVPAAGVAGETFGQVSIANVAAEDPVTLTVRVASGGAAEVLPAFDRVELGAGRRTVVDLAGVRPSGVDPSALLEIEATGPVVVEQALGFAEPAVVTDAIAIPVRDTLAVPPGDLFDRLGLALPPGGGPTLPVGTLPPVPPGTDQGTLVPLGPPGSDAVGPLDGGTLPPVVGPDGQPVTTTTTSPPPAAGDPTASSTTTTATTAPAAPGLVPVPGQLTPGGPG